MYITVSFILLVNKMPRFLKLFLYQDLLQDDGGLNQLGETYTGARTIHTEPITSSTTSAYQTFNGADSTTQTPATTWATLAGSALQLGAIDSGWLLISTIILLGCSLGTLWTVTWALWLKCTWKKNILIDNHDFICVWVLSSQIKRPRRNLNLQYSW